MDYSEFDTQDFIEDSYFRKWVMDPDEKTNTFWEDWLDQNLDKRASVEEARRTLQSISFPYYRASDQRRDAVWNRISETRSKLSAPGETKKEKSSAQDVTRTGQLIPLSKTFFIWKRVAAVFFPLIVSVAVYLVAVEYYGFQKYATDFEQSKSVTLPDGSGVVLNANSQLKFKNNWTHGETREVWLSGEAFFSVTHTEGDDKFVVHSNTVGIEVLGTEFNVNNRRGRTQVVLNSGIVRLNLPEGKVAEERSDLTMRPGDLVEVHEDKQTLIRKVVDPESYSSWREGIIIFDKISLEKVAEFIEDHYGYRVRLLGQQVASKVYTGSMNSKDLDLILELLSETFDIEVEKNEAGKEIILKEY